jgi:hypothetical protein
MSIFFINNSDDDFTNLAAIGSIYMHHIAVNTSNAVWDTAYTNVLNQVREKFGDTVSTKTIVFNFNKQKTFPTLPAYVQTVTGILPFEKVLCVEGGGAIIPVSELMTLEKANGFTRFFPYDEMKQTLIGND